MWNEGKDVVFDPDAENDDTETPQGRETPNHDDWNMDQGEKARQVYFWRNKAKDVNQSKLKNFWKAAHVIVLNQHSSASAERAFSQPNFMVHACGQNCLEETVSMCMKLRCDLKEHEDYTM